MNATHRKTLRKLLASPPPTDLDWEDILSLLEAVGVDVRPRPASRVAFVCEGEVMVVCRPHEKPLAVQATVRDVAAFLKVIGVKP